MFENVQEEEMENLLKSNSEFRVLYHHHKDLDNKVRDAELGVLPMDGMTLANLKKEKLRAKDKLLEMWESRGAVTS